MILKCIAGIATPDSGYISLNGRVLFDSEKKINLKASLRKTGYLFQDYALFPTMTARENINIVMKKKNHELVDKWLSAYGLEKVADNYPKKLSGGQKQRVGIARALTTTPDILLCDEATSALDPQTTESILKLLKKINREMGVTILLITHQMQVVQMICNKVAVMENGQVVEAGSVLDVFGKPQTPVTRRFVQTVVNDQIPESIISLVKEQKEHFRVERLKFIGSSVKRPVISDICHVDGIVVNILGATVQELQENVMCVFILQLIGAEEKILEAEKQIDGNGVIRERVEAI